jgi:hypothetical protein
VSQTKALTGIERRDRYAAQNGVQRLTPAQRRRMAKKTRAYMGDSEGATPKRPKAPVQTQATKGRKRFYADFMRSHYARTRQAMRRAKLGQKLGRYTAPRG